MLDAVFDGFVDEGFALDVFVGFVSDGGLLSDCHYLVYIVYFELIPVYYKTQTNCSYLNTKDPPNWPCYLLCLLENLARIIQITL